MGLVEPGFLQFGVSLFNMNVSSGKKAVLTLGAAPKSSDVPYESNGNSRPLAGPDRGPYVGGKLRLSF